MKKNNFLLKASIILIFASLESCESFVISKITSSNKYYIYILRNYTECEETMTFFVEGYEFQKYSKFCPTKLILFWIKLLYMRLV